MSDANDKRHCQRNQSLEGRALLRPSARVLAGLAVLVLALVLAGGAYQSIAGVFILVLALTYEIHRFVVRSK